MAEGAVIIGVKSKPVPPPKPLCSPAKATKGSRKTSLDASSPSVQPPHLSVNIGEEVDTKRDLNLHGDQSPGKRIKPRILPKPIGLEISSKAFRGEELQLLASRNSSIFAEKSDQCSEIPDSWKLVHNTEDENTYGNTCASNSEVLFVRKAPVAKLDEFDSLCDYVNPIRPPRSPKVKEYVGGPLLRCDGKKPELPSKKKSLSFGSYGGFRVGNYARMRPKTCSLEQRNIDKFKQLVDSQARDITSNFQTESCPVPPPRRRKKSDGANSPDVIIFSTQGVVPIYAQVNYALKQNRRTDSHDSENKYTFNQGLIQHERLKCADVGDSYNNSENTCITSPESAIEKVNEDVIEVVEISKEVSRVDVATINYLPNPMKNQSDSGLINSDSLKKEVDHKDDYVFYDDCVEGELFLECVADCPSPNKLEWQSSYSGGGTALESLQSECGCFIKDFELNRAVSEQIQFDCKTNDKDILWDESCYEKSSKNGNNMQTTANSLADEIEDDNMRMNVSCSISSVEINERTKGSQESLKYSNECCNIVAHQQKSCSIKETCDSSIVSSSLGKERDKYKFFTSSLPSKCKPSTIIYRRKSWCCPKDRSHSSECQKYKQAGTLWLDEGDLSSGTLADLDSSDNAARRNSFEEVHCQECEYDRPNRVGRKFITWWGSFGKSSKKHRVSKRLSHFYCEQQESSGSEGQVLKSDTSGYEDSSCLALERLSVSLDSAPNKNMTGEQEAVVIETQKCEEQHSDSEVEDTNSQSIVEDSDSRLINQNNERKAFLIAQELMTSERVFIDVLKLLTIDFKMAVEEAEIELGNCIIPSSDLCRIINSLPQLQRLNEELLQDLELRIENWSSIQKIADVIVKKGPFLKLYTTYIQNFEAQCSYFDECCQKYPKFAKVVRDFESLPRCQKLSVKHFMLKPVQRIPQYRLLLDDYFHHQTPQSPDFEDTQIALRIVSDVAEHANRSIKLGDNFSKLLQLQSQLGNYEIIKPGRTFLKSGELFKLSRKDQQPRYFILLNDLLLYTSYYGSGPASGLRVNSELPLGGMKVSIPQAEDYHNEFSIISSTRSFTLSARSLSERTEWVSALQDAIQEYTSRQLSFQNQKLNLMRNDCNLDHFKLGKEAPVWIQDGRVTKCQSCIAEFTVTFRRHHCRACGKVVCGSCSEYRAPLQYMKFQAARVCEECFKILLKEFEDPAINIHDVIKSELAEGECPLDSFETIKSHFKKLGPSSGKKTRKYVPQRLLEVTANDSGSHISGWLQRRGKRSWKRFWFVLKEQVLYVYKASEDVAALQTIPVLGYKVEPMKERHFQLYEGIDARFVFQLTHHGELQPLVFSADSEHLANRWISAMLDATVLK